MAMHQQQLTPSFLLDALCCEDEKWVDEDEEISSSMNNTQKHLIGENPNNLMFCLPLLEQDLFWEDDELLSLFSKEQEQLKESQINRIKRDHVLYLARQEAIEWILKVNCHYGFSCLTAILAINYLDRFLCSPCFQRDKPWMIQLVSVSCLSLAAKIEETQVPLLLDFQVEETEYLFEAKTIQRMELLVLSNLQWKMHPVTPHSFLDHITRMIGLKTQIHWEFHRKCQILLLSVVSDWRFIGFLPSVMATATMMYVIDQVELVNPIEYKNQLLGVLEICKGKVTECYGLIVELTNSNYCYASKRKYDSSSDIDDCLSSNGNTNGSSSPNNPSSLFKKAKTFDDDKPLPLMISLNRVFFDLVGSPR